jgi:hypothetical protein
MKYYYVMSDIVRPYWEGVYYTMDEIKEVRVIAENDPELVKVWDEVWPIHDPDGWSTEAVECESIEQAYEYLLNSENNSVASYNMDI